MGGGAGVRKAATGANFEVTGTQADFERDDDIDLNEQYGDESGSQGEGGSDDDAGSFYQPTLITKTKPSTAGKKKGKTKSITKKPEGVPSIQTS